MRYVGSFDVPSDLRFHIFRVETGNSGLEYIVRERYLDMFSSEVSLSASFLGSEFILGNVSSFPFRVNPKKEDLLRTYVSKMGKKLITSLIKADEMDEELDFSDLLIHNAKKETVPSTNDVVREIKRGTWQ